LNPILMKTALEEAENALKEGEIPVGCVFSCPESAFKGNDTSNFTKLGETILVVTGSNKTNKTRNGTAHAELVAIQKLFKSVGSVQACEILSQCDLHVTCEPCIMCAAALKNLGIKCVYFGCCNDRFGGNGSILSIHNGEDGYRVERGLMEKEAIAIFQQFYESENRRAPESKRRRKNKES